MNFSSDLVWKKSQLNPFPSSFEDQQPWWSSRKERESYKLSSLMFAALILACFIWLEVQYNLKSMMLVIWLKSINITKISIYPVSM